MGDMLASLLIGGGGGALSWLLNQIPGLGPKTSNINQDYVNNPIWQQLFGAGGGYGKTDSSMQSMLGNAITAGNAYDPTAFWKDFMAAQPGMQDIVSGATGSVKAAQEANLSDFIKQAVADTGQEMSGMGALYSGAMGNIAGQKIGAEAGKSSTDLATLQAQMLSSLMGQSMSGFQSGEQFKTSSQIQTYLGGANMYNQQLMQMLGIGADLSSPVYQTQPGLADSIMGGLGLGLQGMAASAMAGGGGKKKAATSWGSTGFIPGANDFLAPLPVSNTWGGSLG
jgi:hypothetical protein